MTSTLLKMLSVSIELEFGTYRDLEISLEECLKNRELIPTPKFLVCMNQCTDRNLLMQGTLTHIMRSRSRIIVYIRVNLIQKFVRILFMTILLQTVDTDIHYRTEGL